MTGSWNQVGDQEVKFSFSHRIRRLFTLSATAQRTKVVEREIAEDWLDETGTVLLIGEAAHPLMVSGFMRGPAHERLSLSLVNSQPCTMQNSSLAVEDAAVLGSLMSHLNVREQIPQLLEAFRDVRHARCLQVHESEYRNAMLVTLPPGEDRDMRDAGFARSLQTSAETVWDDTMLREQWDEIGEVFGYNAHEAAEDWWVKWGALGRGEHVHTPLDLVFKVTEVAIAEV